ncbi:MAG TPA: DUF2207 domain-containing protein, partial [Gaiellaceae bacterium]|nr:DUF2207 domain-containing protein [Gaiellaceae bacterium]
MVEEQIAFYFSGSFTGAYREIPLREGESVTDIAVEEAGRSYAPGASAEIGGDGAPDTFGVARLDDAVRIVWHYQASFEPRTFTVRYRLEGLAVAYDDVVDVNLQVWGDRWKTGLATLSSRLTLPGDEAPADSFQVFGHPAWVSGETFKTPGQAHLQAFDIPAEQFVELRVVFPRELLASTGGAQVREGDGLPSILAEEREDAEA